MKCKKIRFCFYDYEDNAVDQITRFAIDSHLSGCASCRLHYETQRQLHRNIANTVGDALAGLHFQPRPVNVKLSDAYHNLMPGMWVRRVVYSAACLMILCAALWLIHKPEPESPELMDAQMQSAYAEAFRSFELYGTSRITEYNFSMPVAIIIQPGAPARIIELDGTNDISAAIK